MTLGWEEEEEEDEEGTDREGRALDLLQSHEEKKGSDLERKKRNRGREVHIRHGQRLI